MDGNKEVGDQGEKFGELAGRVKGEIGRASVQGKSVDLGGRRIMKKKKNQKQKQKNQHGHKLRNNNYYCKLGISF